MKSGFHSVMNRVLLKMQTRCDDKFPLFVLLKIFKNKNTLWWQVSFDCVFKIKTQTQETCWFYICTIGVSLTPTTSGTEWSNTPVSIEFDRHSWLKIRLIVTWTTRTSNLEPRTSNEPRTLWRGSLQWENAREIWVSRGSHDLIQEGKPGHRKSSLYLPLGSVNLVLKVLGTPDEISSPPGWNRVSPGCPRNFNTELTEPTRQIKTTFPWVSQYCHALPCFAMWCSCAQHLVSLAYSESWCWSRWEMGSLWGPPFVYNYRSLGF